MSIKIRALIIMQTFLIGYDLNKAGQDYTKLIDAIKALATLWWHHLDSTWIITTGDDQSAASIRDSLKKYIDGNDELLVINVTGRQRAWDGFNESGSKWLRDSFV